MHRIVETPQGPMYQGVKTQRCPMYRGVAKLDPLKIKKSPKYRRVETPRCPRYQESRDSPVSYVPGSQDSSVFCESKLPCVLCTRESFFVFMKLQAHAAAFKATLIQKTV